MRPHIGAVVEGTIAPIGPCLCAGDRAPVEDGLALTVLACGALILDGVKSIFFDENKSIKLEF